MKIQDFSGGLSTRLNPQFLNLNEAVQYKNVDNSKGSLSSVKSSSAVSLDLEDFAYYYEREGIWLSSSSRRDYAEVNGWLYWTDGVKPKKYKDGVTKDLGIASPTNAPAIADDGIAGPSKVEFSFTASGGDFHADSVHNYKIVVDNGTFYSAPLDIQITVNSAIFEVLKTVKQSQSLILKSMMEKWSAARQALIVAQEAVNNLPMFADRFTALEAKKERADAELAAAQRKSEYTTQKAIFDTSYEAIYQTATGSNIVTFAAIEGVDYTSNTVVIFREYNGYWRKVGEITSAGGTLDDTTVDISSNDLLDPAYASPVNGYMQYVYTFYDKDTGTESGPSNVSDIAYIQGATTITDLQVSSSSAVTHKRIYRVGNNISTFSLVAEIDNATTTYIDSIWDEDLSGSTLSTDFFGAPPNNLKYLTEAYGMLVGAEGSKLRFTPIGRPDAWPAVYFIEMGEEITGIAQVGTGLLVFSKFRTKIVYGTSPTTLSTQPLNADQGCINASSIQLLNSYALWVSSDGICASNGSTVTVVSRPKMGKITLAPIQSIVYDEVYYVLEASGEILAYDYRFEPIFKRLNLGVTTLAKGEDILYGKSSSSWVRLFNSSDLEELSYLSPRFVEGRITEDKTYKKVYISYTGDIIISVYIDDELVSTTELSEPICETIQIPQDSQRGHYIQIGVTGKGEVSELEYEAGRGNHG